MNAINPSEAEFEAHQNFWNVTQKIWLKRGFDLEQKFLAWANKEAQALSKSDAKSDFNELCACGCAPLVLAAIAALIRELSELLPRWLTVVGSPYRRRAVIQSSRKTLLLLEQYFLSSPVEGQTIPLGTYGVDSPVQLISQLRIIIEVVSYADELVKGANQLVLRNLAKYLLINYVKQTTHDYKDRCVSGLMAHVLGPSDYNESTHRVWRNRNYSKLEKRFSNLARFLFTMGSVITRQSR